MKYLLDTCIISEVTKKKPDEKVVNWLLSIDEQSLFLSVLTIGELQKGITKLTDPSKKQKLETWLNTDLQQRFAGRIININTEIIMLWGTILGRLELLGTKLPVVDSLLAATALCNDLILVTRNVKDIKQSDCNYLNPWE